MRLSIMCVTRGGKRAMPFLQEMASLAARVNAELVIGWDGPVSPPEGSWRMIPVKTGGYQETVQDEVLTHCQGDYVLRLDDDEKVSQVMERWLVGGGYAAADNWQFARAWLWPDEDHHLSSPPHWPDYQTRLSLKAKAGGRVGLHSPSPFGAGETAPGALEHHKLLLWSVEEREDLLRHYDARQPGSGEPFRSFYLPAEGLPVAPWTAPWSASGVDDPPAAEILLRADAMGFRLAQFDSEIRDCINWLFLHFGGRPARILEIGTDFGGTAAVWCELATEQMVSVDLPGVFYGNPEMTAAAATVRNAKLLARYPHFLGLLGDSHSQVTRDRVADALRDSKLDVLFIDGDHSYSGVSNDYTMYSGFVRKGGVILFHDIVETDLVKSMGVGVYRFWSELPGDKREFNVHGDWGGLGALIT